MNTPKIHTVCITGADSDVAARVASLLDELRTRLDDRWRVADYASADLLLIQTDSVYGHMDWLKAEGNGRRVAALTSTPASYAFALGLPVTPAGVVELLNRVSAHIDGRCASAPSAEEEKAQAAVPDPLSAPAAAASAASADPASPPPPAAAVPAAPPVRGLSLLDLLDGSARLSGKLHLHADGLPDLFVDTYAATWHSAAGLKGLAPWCTRTLDEDARAIDDGAYAGHVATMQAQPAARLKWLAHLVRGDGRLEAGLDANATYKLARWPQSEREFPKHFRIATVMLKQAHTPEEIAGESGASTADVVNFINAYNALGYIERGDAHAATDGRGAGLFGRAKKTGAMS